MEFIIILNIIFNIILIINLYFLFFSNNYIIYKNVDNFITSFRAHSYYQMSNYLNIKYLYSNNLNNSSEQEKTNISLYFIQFHNDPFHNKLINELINILKNKYLVYINQNNPDYLIYNVFGCQYLDSRYNNSIKIAFFTENQLPDFSKADYCIGNSHINYLDRYFRMPFYFVNRISQIKYEVIEEIRTRILINPIRTKFCSAVISNGIITDGFRLTFIKELNKYKKVDMGGRYKNNVGKIKNKIKFFSSYKFSISMENTEGEGYISEKIIDSFLSGTIPIYYGDYMLDEFINPETYILIRGEKDIKEKIEYIKKIDNNIELYKSIMRKKVFLSNKYANKTKKDFTQFIEHIFEQNKKMAKRIDGNYF